MFTRRRGRPFVDGYGTPAFVSKESAGGGPVIDIGTYEVGRMLYLLGNPDVERPTQFDHWVETIRGSVDPIPTGEISLNSTLVMEGIYQSAELGREVSAEEVTERSVSRSVDL